MLFPIKNIQDLEIINELLSLEIRVKAKRLQDKLGKHNFHKEMMKVFETVTRSVNDVSEHVTKTITETSIKDNTAIEILNDKRLEIMKDRGILTPYLLFPLSKITNPESTSQYKLVKDISSKIVNDLLIHNSIPITLLNNLLTFRDTNKEFELTGDLLKMITNKNYNFDLASVAGKTLIFDFAKEMYFDVRAPCDKSTRDKTPIKLFNSPG